MEEWPKSWISGWLLPLTGCIALGKFLTFSEPHVPYCTTTISPLMWLGGLSKINISKST
jgi:hypothetical protein